MSDAMGWVMVFVGYIISCGTCIYIGYQAGLEDGKGKGWH